MKMARFFMFIASMVFIPFYAFAIETMSDDDMSNITAKSGVTIFLEGKLTMTQEFTNVGIGDDDGIGGGTSSGWIIMDSGGETSFVEISMKDAKFEIDVASTGADGYDFIGNSAPDIPAYTSFVRFGLPDNIAVNTFLANGYHLYVNNEYSTIGASYMGEIRISDIQFQMNGTPTALYIYGH